MVKYPFVSIIIPTNRSREVLEQCLNSLSRQSYPKERIEVILISEKPLGAFQDPRIRVLSGFSYGVARNEGVKVAAGDIIAFLDDDCIAPKDWIANAMPYFEKQDVALIGGSAVPFKNDAFVFRVGGYLLQSVFASGFASGRYRVIPHVYEAKEYNLLAANNFMRRSVFEKLGGFDSSQVPSEENDLYFRLKLHGYRMLYVPEIFTWHRAKALLFPLLQRTFFYATGRGMLMCRKPKSIRFIYLVPSLFVAFLLVFGITVFLQSEFAFFSSVFLLAYGTANVAHAFFVFWKYER
ncbi:MAG TPA: glycosyltransferase, partial [Candidatus Paceibacterota bacterium]